MCHGWLEHRRLREEEAAGRRLWEEFARAERDFEPHREVLAEAVPLVEEPPAPEPARPAARV